MNACKPILKPMQSTCKRPAKRANSLRKMGREETKYWGLWKEIFQKFNVPSSEQSAWRKDLRMQVLGSERTQTTFTNGDYDVVLGAMREMLAQSQLVVYPEKIILEYMEGESRRILKLITDLQMPPAYIAAISRNKFGTPTYKNLIPCEMMHLFYTCKARKIAADKKGKSFYDNKVSSDKSSFIEASPDDDPF